VNFIFHVFIVRKLGDERFGQYSIVLAFVGVFQIFAELGISQYVMREVARDITKARVYFWNLVMIRCLLAVIAMLVLPVAASLMGYSPILVLGIFIYSASFLFSAIAVPLGDILTAGERVDYLSTINVICQIFFVIFGAAFLFLGMNFIWLIVASLISILPRIVIGAVAIRHLHITELPFQIDFRLWPAMLKAGLPFGITSLMLSIAFSIDTVILSKFQPERVVGWYNAAYGLIFSIVYLFGGFRAAIVPSLAKVFVSDRKKIDDWFQGSVKFYNLISIPMAFGGAIVAKPLIEFLYTPQYLPAGTALQILIWDLPLVLFSGFCWDMAIVVGEERAAARINIINTVANVILNLFFIPSFGFIAASVITVLTDLISTIQFWFLFRGKIKTREVRSILVRIALASALMAVPTWLARNFNLFLVLAIAVLAYSGLLILFRLVGGEEIEAVTRLAKKFGIVWKVQKIM
jgi:O-antigen/teichoic acid export membrane protein